MCGPALYKNSMMKPNQFFFCRLPVVEQPRQLDHRAQVRLLRRGGDGLLHLLPQDPLLQTQQAHHPLLLQRGKHLGPTWDTNTTVTST